MGYIIEPKNVDLVVGPSVLTEKIKTNITQAITQYKKNGLKPKSVDVDSPGQVNKYSLHSTKPTIK